MTDPRDRARIEEELRRADEELRQVHITTNNLVERKAQDALTENMRDESGASRGAAGGCNQSVDNLPR